MQGNKMDVMTEYINTNGKIVRSPGLSQIKAEGMASRYDYPEIMWYHYHLELCEYFFSKYKAWYFKPFKKILYKIAESAWDEALFINAKINHGVKNATFDWKNSTVSTEG